MERPFTASTRIALVILAAIFAVQTYQALTEPIRPAEAYTYDRFVRPTLRQLWQQELPNPDFLFTLLEKRSVGLFRVSPISVRLPSLMFGLLYMWAAWGLLRALLGERRWFVLGIAVAAVLPLQWDCFTTAQGLGAAVALDLCALRFVIRHLVSNPPLTDQKLNLAGACFGLAIAASWNAAVPTAVLVLICLIALGARRQWTLWIDRLFIPAVVVLLVLLVLPLSHAHAAPERTPNLSVTSAHQLQSASQVLRASAGGNRIRIGASAAAEPVLNFYRSQYRATKWSRVARDFADPNLDYYLLAKGDFHLVAERQLIVLYQDGDFVLARRIPDGM